MPSRSGGSSKPEARTAGAGGTPKEPKPGAPKAGAAKGGAAKEGSPKEAPAREAAAQEGPPKARKWPKGGPSKADVKRYRQKLEELRSGQVRDTRGLASEALKSSGQDFSVDHMADHGSDNFEQDFTLGLLEGKTEALRDVASAIDKIDGKGELPFGLCEVCADHDEARWARQQARGCETCPWIPKGRLDVVPYARLCIRRQEEQEGGR